MYCDTRLRKSQAPLRSSLRAIALGVALAASAPAMAAEMAETDTGAPIGSQQPSAKRGASKAVPGLVEFESGFIRALGQDIDLSRFERDESVTEGEHPVELVINDTEYGTLTLPFQRNPASGRIEACLPATLLERIGLDPQRQLKPVEAGQCAFLDDLVEGAASEYDGGEQKLSMTIPQAFLLYRPRGYVPLDALDTGVTAATFRYSLSYTNSQYSGKGSGEYLYGGLQSAFNLGAWRFRTYGTLSSSDGQATRWNHVAAYAQRPLPSIQSEAIFGDWNTTGTLFDSTGIRGVSLYTDDRMLPESQRGYAPVVRGVARSNAVVTVRQGGAVLYETNVPPGEFEFRDLYSTGYGGDLDVTVTEADGSVQRFAVPYGSIAQLLRADYTKYSLTFGQIRDDAINHAPILMEGTVQHGLTDDITLYGGAQITAPTYYASIMGGLAVNTPLGALGLDVTQSFSLCVDTARDCEASGYSVRASLGRQFTSTGTYFSLVGYRYSSPGFYSLMDAMLLREVRNGNSSVEPLRLRDRFDMNVTQSLGEGWGNLFLTGSYGRRWEDNGRTLSYQAGYSNSWGRARYHISVGRTRNAMGAHENSVFLSVSLPLGRSATPTTPTLGFTASRVGDATDMRANLIGNFDEDARASYDTWFDVGSGGRRSAGATLGYAGDAAKGNVTYGYSPGVNSFGANLSGGVVVHGGGVAFTSELGDTVALVEAEGAAGAKVLPFSRTRVGKDGTAIVPYITPYTWNNVELDLKGADMGVQVDNTKISTAPTAGAVVKVKFDSRRTASAVLRLSQPDGTPVPFGASVTLPDGTTVGTVGGGGTVVAADLPDSGSLNVVWGKSAGQQCSVHYEPQAAANGGAGDAGLHVRAMACEPGSVPAVPPAPLATQEQS
ncbi:fimbria/pilus outer membrane usher protein [Cupriavidus agavae]|uniref:Outer membrane usher protein n=1 Tax=Cupriavidus agavae TaxID=1001822 RepID=A0A4Q7S945_9BURK|nr:fimbria/pilus outer membrane usher protein [Cupriavidus agavae]RZT42935.1 outer membrane usher protein [Cupriavidus agavae]